MSLSGSRDEDGSGVRMQQLQNVIRGPYCFAVFVYSLVPLATTVSTSASSHEEISFVAAMPGGSFAGMGFRDGFFRPNCCGR